MRLSVCSVTNISLNADYLGMVQLCVKLEASFGSNTSDY